MPRPDPVPPKRTRDTDYERAANAWAQYKKTMRWMALAAVTTVALALLYLYRSGGPMPLHMVVATIAGVFLTVMVGTGLMALVFLSNRSGHDVDAGQAPSDDDR